MTKVRNNKSRALKEPGTERGRISISAYLCPLHPREEHPRELSEADWAQGEQLPALHAAERHPYSSAQTVQRVL
jgi:hypothetical protein